MIKLIIAVIPMSLKQIRARALAFLESCSSTIAESNLKELMPTKIATYSKNNLKGAKSSGP